MADGAKIIKIQSSDDPNSFVVVGARTICNQSLSKTTVKVKSDRKADVLDGYGIKMLQKDTDKFKNFEHKGCSWYGACKALGSLKCDPRFVKEWKTRSKMLVVEKKLAKLETGKADVQFPLLKSAVLFCKNGGVIRFLDNGQELSLKNARLALLRILFPKDSNLSDEALWEKHMGSMEAISNTLREAAIQKKDFPFSSWDIIYYDDKGNKYFFEWKITDEMFLDANSLTQEQITAICEANNSGLVERGFDVAIYEFCQARGINPLIVLATLKWEQGWCKPDPKLSDEENEAKYDKAFGVGPAGTPNSYGEGEFGGIGDTIDIYLGWYEKGSSLNYPATMKDRNQDTNLQDKADDGSVGGYVNSNPQSKDYFLEGQDVAVPNAAAHSRLMYNPWLYYPPNESHSTFKWHNTVLALGGR
jgi:hypothetical protein